jgi:hypothetical protein
MNRSGHEAANFFLGREVERTPAHGKPTLFVVGVQSIDSIAAHLQGCEHIFFGANHSFDPSNFQSITQWSDWESMIQHFLDLGYLCTLDIPLTAVAQFNDGGLCEHNNFIPQIRVPVPYVRLWNYNTMIKIDDQDFDSSNPGVWCHSLHSLMTRDTFTPWSDYSNDQVVS